MRILITGCAGMLGKALVEVLSAGNEVMGLDITEPRGMEAGLESFFHCSITDAGALDKVFSKARAEAVINTAAWTDVDGCEKNPGKARLINAEGAGNVAGAASNYGTEIVHISTDFVFNGKKSSPYTENDAADPLSVYGKTKRDGEKAVRDSSHKWSVIRTSWLYGAGGGNFVETILAKARLNNRLRVVSDQVGSPTYARDLALAIEVFLSGARERGLYHVSNSGQCSWFDFSRRILREARIEDTEIEPISSEELARPAERPAYSAMDSGKFVRRTGYIMRSWDDALKDYMEERKHVQDFKEKDIR